MFGVSPLEQLEQPLQGRAFNMWVFSYNLWPCLEKGFFYRRHRDGIFENV
jgi:hypothetical protein